MGQPPCSQSVATGRPRLSTRVPEIGMRWTRSQPGLVFVARLGKRGTMSSGTSNGLARGIDPHAHETLHGTSCCSPLLSGRPKGATRRLSRLFIFSFFFFLFFFALPGGSPVKEPAFVREVRKSSTRTEPRRLGSYRPPILPLLLLPFLPILHRFHLQGLHSKVGPCRIA